MAVSKVHVFWVTKIWQDIQFFWRTYFSNLRQIKLGDSVILLWPSQKIRTLLSRRILSMSFWNQKIRLIYVIIISIWVKLLVFTALFWRLLKIKRKKHNHSFLYGHILTLLVSRCLPRTSTRCIIHQHQPLATTLLQIVWRF